MLKKLTRGTWWWMKRCISLYRYRSKTWGCHELASTSSSSFFEMCILLFFGLSHMLCHYDWKKEIIDGFKSRLAQYKKFESKKWDN